MANSGSREPSRWDPKGPGHFPSLSTHKMRFIASRGLGELGAQVAEVNRLFRLSDEFGTPPPHVITVEDVTRGIVIDPADQQAIQKLVLDTNASFNQKSQTVRLTHAIGRFIETLRHSYKRIDSDTRMELTRRAMTFWKRNYQTDYSKPPTVRYEKSVRFTLSDSLVKGFKYASKKPDGRGGWVYSYANAAQAQAHGAHAQAGFDNAHKKLRHAEARHREAQRQVIIHHGKDTAPAAHHAATKALQHKARVEKLVKLHRKHLNSVDSSVHAHNQHAEAVQHFHEQNPKHAGAAGGPVVRSGQGSLSKLVHKKSLHDNSLIKASGYKYISKKPSGKGGWIYEYPTKDGIHTHEGHPLHHLSEAMTPLHDPANTTTNKTPDYKSVKESLDKLVEHAKGTKGSEKKHILDSLRGHQAKARVHATNMTQYGHEATGNARNVRDALTDSISAIVGKSPESKEKAYQKNAEKYSVAKAHELRRTAQEMADHPMGRDASGKNNWQRNYESHLKEHKERFGKLPVGHTGELPKSKMYKPSHESYELTRNSTNLSEAARKADISAPLAEQVAAHRAALDAHNAALDSHLVGGASPSGEGSEYTKHHEDKISHHEAMLRRIGVPEEAVTVIQGTPESPGEKIPPRPDSSFEEARRLHDARMAQAAKHELYGGAKKSITSWNDYVREERRG